MVRPRKQRKVCSLPENNRFGPLGMESNRRQCITMSIDEYETIRLIDFEGLTQEECAARMHIARTSVQRSYSAARKKIAKSLVDGKMLRIEGGDYRLCNGMGRGCGEGACNRRAKKQIEMEDEHYESWNTGK
ncbi:MAG TPA: DUF134 domain-containing protein [Tepidimicrobium sp.]|nr:DUF134 domain-containing protein [Tepidimicrobium sp.]